MNVQVMGPPLAQTIYGENEEMGCSGHIERPKFHGPWPGVGLGVQGVQEKVLARWACWRACWAC
jgi:hypothetical protein